MNQCLSTHLGAPRLDWFRWCATQPPSATQGMSQWLSTHLGAPRLDWFRSCASQEPASSSKKHKPRVVDPSGRTKAKLVLMACEPGARSSTRHGRARNPRWDLCKKTKACNVGEGQREGRVESERQRAESQWIVAARPLCHLQYPVAYLSRLQRILPAARWELRFKEARTACPPRGLHLRHVPLGAIGPYCGSAIGRRARASFLARILT